MLILIVHIQVKPGRVEDFKRATIDNARNSLQEEGVVRFDFIQEKERPDRFVLHEVYRSPEAHAHHRETPHYRRWKEAVAEMMAADRSSVKYHPVFLEEV